MNTRLSCVKAAGFLLGVFLIGIRTTAALHAPMEKSSNTHRCTGPVYRQFDFWIGDWDVFDVDIPGKLVARARINPILDGCVLLEDYQDTNGHKGQSFNIYDAAGKVWRQSWVTNRGEFLLLRGDIERGSMVMNGVGHSANGQEQRIRGIWKPAENGVREIAVTSVDGGRTWKLWFDLSFRPHKE
jgi:hypothetical protein